MRNPWLKSNPFLSMWLSGANTIASSMRAKNNAIIKRQTAMATREASRQIAESWAKLFFPAPSVPKRRVRKARK